MNTRQISRAEQTVEKGRWDHVNIGSLQRIADACEKMAASYDQMRTSRDFYKEYYERESRLNQALGNRIRSLRGVITRLKRRSAK